MQVRVLSSRQKTSIKACEVLGSCLFSPIADKCGQYSFKVRGLERYQMGEQLNINIMWAHCNFRKENSVGDGKCTQGWIDVKHAKVGKFVQLLEYGKDFWEITFVGSTSKTDPSIANRTWNNNI